MLKQLTFLDYGVAATQEEFLKESIINRKNIIITGNKNSGKTSFLNVCLNELKNKDLRVVTIDDKDELICPAINTTKGQINSEYSAITLIRAYLKMKPDYVILGEVSNANEFFELLKAWNSGHSGMTTYPITDLVNKLYSYSKIDFMQDTFQSLISNTVDIVVEMKDKKVKEIKEIIGYKKDLRESIYKNII